MVDPTPIQNFTSAELHSYICNQNRAEMFAHLGLCLVGMASTATNTFILTRKAMRQSSLNILMAGMEFSNVVFLTFYLPSLVFRLTCPVKAFESWISMVFAVLGNFPRSLVMFTNWMTFFVGAWRLSAIACPLRTRSLLTRRLAVTIITCTGVFSMMLSLYSYFGLSSDQITIRIIQGNTSEIITIFNRTTDTLSSTHFYDFNTPWFITIHVFGYVIPCILALSANAALIASVFFKAFRRRKLIEGQAGQSRRSGETRLTVVLVLLLTANVFCFVTPGFFILNNALCEETDCGPSMPPFWHAIFHDFQAVLVLVCLDFFGYYAMSSNFRETFRELCHELRCKILRYSDRT